MTKSVAHFRLVRRECRYHQMQKRHGENSAILSVNKTGSKTLNKSDFGYSGSVL